MSCFVAFCQSLGIVLDTLPPAGRWLRVPTLAHPRKKNGAVKFLGTYGFAQEHSTMAEVAVWQADGGDGAPVIDHEALRAAQAREHRRIQEGRARAALRAREILSQCRQEPHAYLCRKGFPEVCGLVWDREGLPVLVVPMRVDDKLVGCQLIAEDGDKKFLPGQMTRGATFQMGKGDPVYCEGYATSFSAQQALTASRLPGCVVTCFSAYNMQRLATSGVVLADNDESMTGEKAAKATGRPYWMSAMVGNDFNDDHRKRGLFAVSQDLKRLLMQARRRGADP